VSFSAPATANPNPDLVLNDDDDDDDDRRTILGNAFDSDEDDGLVQPASRELVFSVRSLLQNAIPTLHQHKSPYKKGHNTTTRWIY
jgi:hypothetical protein